jgi:hypothetical protein
MIKTDTVLRQEGMRLLSENLGLVNAERFITIILREPFDYTEWQNKLFPGVPLNNFLADAMAYRKQNEETAEREGRQGN